MWCSVEKKIHGGGGNIKKDAHKATCINSTEENKNRYKNMKSKAKKAVLTARREKTEEAVTELKKNYPTIGC